MKRVITAYLDAWLNSTDRKPLVIRGARQVGKTWLVRHFAKKSGKKLIELNFEKRPSFQSLFKSNDSQEILINLSTVLGQKIEPKECLLFLDEIQAVPELFSKLRWFAEDLPDLPVISAGSLLEFVLEKHIFSMPVGRINYIYLEPMSFEEFLLAKEKDSLYEYLSKYTLNTTVPDAIHEQLLKLFKEYLLVGGLPASVSSWIIEGSLNKINQIQSDLLSTYRDDFSKYSGRLAIERLDEVMMSVPKMLGQKFVFSRVNKSVQSLSIKQAIDLLEKARIIYRVQGVAANGLPLGAEIQEKYFKETFLDTGLCSVALGLGLNDIDMTKIMMINSGGIAEQVVGQLLRTIFPPYVEPFLCCWHRQKEGSNAEVDYIIQQGNKIIPLEVKAGSTGSLKSLHLFMSLKKLTHALRINSDIPSQTNIDVKDNNGNNVKYSLISVPFYLVGQIPRLLKNDYQAGL